MNEELFKNKTDEMIEESEKILTTKKLLKKGDTFVLTSGVPVAVTGTTNMLRIHKIS